jgi:hypothetical protein
LSVVAVVLAAACPARAAEVSIAPGSSSGGPFSGAAVVLTGGANEQVNAVVLGSEPAAPAFRPASLIITDLSGTLTTTSRGGRRPCTIFLGTIATCHVTSGGIDAFDAHLGNRADRLVAASLSNQPLWFVHAGGGDDLVAAPLASENGGSGHTATIDGGPGNDTLIVGAQLTGPRPLRGFGMQVDGGPGDDLIETFNGSTDMVDCGPGADRLIADRRDISPRPEILPSTHCETRLP